VKIHETVVGRGEKIAALFSIGRNIAQLGRSPPTTDMFMSAWRQIHSSCAPNSRRVTMYRDERIAETVVGL